MIKLVCCLGIAACSVFRRKSKLLYFLLLVLMFLLAAGNINSPDKDAYRQYYDEITTVSLHSVVEVGFQFLVVISKSLGLNFNGFLFFFILICFILLHIILQRFSDNQAFALSLYFLYPFILDADQIRSFLGQLIVLAALTEFIKEQQNKWFKYAFFVIIASLFQQSCAVFLVYLLILLNERKVKIITLSLGGILLFGKFLIPLIASRFSVFNLDRVTRYFSVSEAKSTWIIYAFFYIAIILFTILFTKKTKDMKVFMDYILDTDDRKSKGNPITKINLISLALIVLIAFNPHFERLLRPVLLLDYIVMTNNLEKRANHINEVITIVFLIVCCLGRFATYLIGGGWTSYIVPLIYSGSII